MALPSPLPDNPNRWDGWRAYNSDNPYDRLCLSFETEPSDFQIEDHCRQLLVWWQKKLPLKNQPSNPLTQMLRAGLDEAPGYLAEARTALLDPAVRARVDERLRAGIRDRAIEEFLKFLSFTVSNGMLNKDDEKNLFRLGKLSGLTDEEMNGIIAVELEKRGAQREPEPAPKEAAVDSGAKNGAAGPTDPFNDFRRMLRLTGLDSDEMTDDQRDALCNMGENLGLTGGQAEDLIDEYLDEVGGLQIPPQRTGTAGKTGPAVPARPVAKMEKKERPQPKEAAARAPERPPEPAPTASSPLARAQERQKHPDYRNQLGQEMLLVRSGTFSMGSVSHDAGPNEQPVTRVHLSCFYMSRFPVTNGEYEKFDPKHAAKRAPWADDRHPVVYVTSAEAAKFCEWLSVRERRKYRLPTEAEWEYAARGMDGRAYPWGERLERGDLANFADKRTTFAWRDTVIDDGWAETSPVGSYPHGASPFKIEDMAGNVWEWCLDFFEPYKGKERISPLGPTSGAKRVYRGGSWKSRPASLRATARNSNLPDYSSNDVGFRIVCECE